MGGVDNKTPGKAAHLDPLNHKLIGCTAKGNYANGFDRNNQSGVVTMKNCISDLIRVIIITGHLQENHLHLVIK